MKVRTFLVILAALALVFPIAFLLEANQAVLREPIALGRESSVPVGGTLVLFFVLGATLVLVLGGAREAARTWEHWRLRKASLKSEEIEDEYSRGLVALVEGRDDEALTHFRSVLERDSRHFNTLIKLGEILRARERYAEAVEFHRKAHHIKEDNTQPLYALVDDHEAMGDMERARRVLGQIIAINKSSVAAWRRLRALHVKEGAWVKALEAHARVVKLSGTDLPRDSADRRHGLGIRYEMASASLAEGKGREAVAVLRKALKENDQFIPAHVKLGEALRQEGQESEAVQVWHNGFEVTGSPIFLTFLEEHYLQREQPLAALEALKRCIALARKDTVARFYLGRLYFRLEMLDDAFAVLTALEGRASYAPTLHYLLGRIHERRHNHRGAAQEYRKVIKEMDLVQLEYGCRACRETSMEWAPRCANCGEWNTIEVNFREEISLDELGLVPAPVYTIHD